MKKSKYIGRIVDQELENRLKSSGIVLIEGPKACGKTRTAREFAKSEVLLDVNENARKIIQIDPNIILDGEHPRLIDEWHLEPTIWNVLRRRVDDEQIPGKYILTGSAMPADSIVRHTGAGRISRLKMRTMSLFEQGYSSGRVSMAEIMKGQDPESLESKIDIQELSETIVRGGWPGSVSMDQQAAARFARDYVDEVPRTDIQSVDGVKRDSQKVRRLLRSLARNLATITRNTVLAKDVSISEPNVADYLSALERLMIVEPQEAWKPSLRSRARLRQGPKLHFVDPSMACALLDLSAERLVHDMNYFGFLFESLVTRDLRVYAQQMNGKLLHYKDNTLEVDSIVELGDGSWAAFEVKMGQGQIDDAAKSLLELKNRIDGPPPSTLGVITGGGYSHRRPDGVVVIPIRLLGP